MNAPMSSSAGSRATSSTISSSHPSPLSQTMAMPVPGPAPGRTSSADPFLKDFTLVAEAAKRAQMAVMVRDFENCGL
ncbi:hypothetical protein S40285_01249 [Stachybotrys chlorohalonatus IBT 40285]|uniref:Uncharacterized protein n=1 Tax=Stachybotrys chlorohalonatus (strain IBT 40285) TaxID=1283841 RepID=A0A084QQV0_STAC4|nr:hypothetical protein S40285_01249 [Stachybotrys chlorohalonata IBT 40285]